MLTTGVTLLMASIAFMVKDVILFRHSIVYSLSSLTQVIGMNSEGTLLFNDKDSAESNLAALRAMPYVFFACIYDKDGKVFATYRRDDVPLDVTPPEHQASGHYFKDCGPYDYLFLFQPIRFEDSHEDERYPEGVHAPSSQLSDAEQPDNKISIGTVFIQYDLEEMFFKMKEAVFIFAVIMCITFIVVLLLSSSLQRIISDPIVNLTQATMAISQEKDFSIRAMCQCGQDEIGFLVARFNDMLAEIQEQDIQLKQHRENELKQHQKYLHL